MMIVMKDIKDVTLIEDQRNNQEMIVKYDDYGNLIMLRILTITKK